MDKKQEYSKAQVNVLEPNTNFKLLLHAGYDIESVQEEQSTEFLVHNAHTSMWG